MSKRFNQFKGHYDNINNQYSYSGAYYRLRGGEKKRKAFSLREIILLVAGIICIFVSGFTLAGRMSASWTVVVPFVLEIAVCAWQGWYLVKFLEDTGRFKEPTVKKVVPVLPWIGLIVSLFTLCGFIASLCIIYAFGTEGLASYSICYIVTKMLHCVIGILSFFNAKGLKFDPEDDFQ